MVARLFLWLAVALVPLQPADTSDRTLKGLGPIAIAIDPLAPAATRLGVTADALRDEIARSLTAAKLPVSTDASGPRLTISINAVPIETTRRSASGVSYSVTVAVDQDVTVTATGESARATTWRRAGIGVASAAKAKEAIRGQLKEYVDAFVAAWRTENQREKAVNRGPEASCLSCPPRLPYIRAISS
jgi:hypothetical protein